MKKFPLIQFLFFICLTIFYSSLLGETPLENPFSLEPPAEELPLDNSRFIKEFAYMLLMLGILISLVYFAAWFLKRMTTIRVDQLNASSNIKVVEKRVISNKTTVFLLEIGDREILVAETPTTVVQLHTEKET